MNIFITGASRGIGRAIALRCAREGANVVIAAKTDEPHPKLPGTIHSVAEEVREAGGEALPIKVDIRHESEVQEAVRHTVEVFGGIDVLINNAGAIDLSGTLDLSMKKFDLMMACNARGAFLCSKECIPFLKESDNPHIVNISPPFNIDSKWFKNHLGYSLSKYAMSMCTLGMSAEFIEDGIAVNSIWPAKTIATSAVEVFFPKLKEKSRQPEFMAEAVYRLITKDSRAVSGNFFLDEEILEEEGITDFSSYAVHAGTPLSKDLFVD